MCGITGILSPKINRERLEQANDLLHHRGPDDAGIFIADGIGLAAPQVGNLEQLLVIGIPQEDDSLRIKAFLNPEILVKLLIAM